MELNERTAAVVRFANSIRVESHRNRDILKLKYLNENFSDSREWLTAERIILDVLRFGKVFDPHLSI